MRNARYGMRVGILGTLLILTAGCQTIGQPKPPAKKPAPPRPKAGVTLSLTLDKKTYGVGDPVQVTLTLKNTGKDAVRLNFSSGQRFDIEIRQGKEGKGAVVWQWAKGRMFTMALGSVQLPGGKTQTYQETCRPENLVAGTYTIVATITTMGEAPRLTATTPLTVQKSAP